MLLYALLLLLMLVALIDAIRIDDSRVKYMHKVVWILLIIFIPLVGIVLWFALGRSYEGAPIRMPRRRSQAATGGSGWQASVPMGTATVTVHPVPSHDGRSTEEQLADLEREIEQDQHRRAALEQGRDAGSAGSAAPPPSAE